MEGEVPNRYRVSKRTWERWHPLARQHFNDLYDEFHHSQGRYNTRADRLHPADWRQLSWNLAYEAAESLSSMLNKLTQTPSTFAKIYGGPLGS